MNMNINGLLYSTLSLGGMGLIFGAGLAYASQKFAVEIDSKAVAVREVLPGANCGGCGYPGCDGFANAVAKGDAPVNGCPVGGVETAEKVAAIMGLVVEDSAKMVAHVICNGTCDNAREKYEYIGIQDCKAANIVNGGSKSCSYGCLGLGTCVDVCPFDAIFINDKGIAEVIDDKCTACGNCIEACPKDVITLVPYGQEVIVECNSKDTGKNVKASCDVGCIGCKICEKNCPFDAIHVVDNLAVIDYTKCTGCMICVEKCPTGAISGNLENRKKA
jgi:RnfABCDGE-type electron transport complex B subunit